MLKYWNWAKVQLNLIHFPRNVYILVIEFLLKKWIYHCKWNSCS